MNYQLRELSIEVTARCLMKCIMCSSGSGNSEEHRLHPGMVSSLIREAKGLGASVVSFSGGDPLTMLDTVIEYVELADGLGYDEILFYTSGNRLVYENGKVSALKFMNIELFEHIRRRIGDTASSKLKFVFSLHSKNPVVHDYITGVSGAFNNTYQSISRCVAAGFAAWVHCVPMLPNWGGVRELYSMVSEMGVAQMSLLRFVPQTRGLYNNRQLALNVGEFTELQYEMDSIVARGWKSQCRLRLGCPIDFRHAVIPYKYNHKMHQCHAGKDLMLVRSDGSVHPCAAWKTLPDGSNIYNATLKDIWENGEVFSELRIYHDGGWAAVGGACQECCFQSSCHSGCLAQRLHAKRVGRLYTDFDDISEIYDDMPDPLCPVGARYEPYSDSCDRCDSGCKSTCEETE